MEYIHSKHSSFKPFFLNLLVGNNFWGSWGFGTFGTWMSGWLFSIPVLFYMGHYLLPPSFPFFFLLVELLHSTMFLSACDIPHIILGTRCTAPCSFETYYLRRKLNNKQLRQVRMFTMTRARESSEREQCNSGLEGAGRPLASWGSWNLNKKDQAVSSFLCLFPSL